MSILDDVFSSRRGQRRVAEFMLRNGISVKSGKLFFSGVELADVKVARALDVDRRVVRTTIDSIEKDKRLKDL